MYELSPPPELDDLEAFEEQGAVEGWVGTETEGSDDLEEGGAWEVEALRRRRPVRLARRRVRQPRLRRRPVRRIRPRARTPVVRRRRARVTRPYRRVPRSRRLPVLGIRRYSPYRRRRPVRVVRRTFYVPYPRYYPDVGTPITSRTRPAAVLSRFFFESASLRRHHLPQIRRIARRIVASWRTGRPIRMVRLVGHTDNRGSARFNRQLGRQRALAVRDRLTRELNWLRPGLTRRLTIVTATMGEARPIASNRTATGRAVNRRVEIFLSHVWR